MATDLYKPDVVVVGAGLSGLRTAREVQNAGLSCVVLESLDRVGSRTLSTPTKENRQAPVDLGAAWINDSSQTEMFALAQAFGFDLLKQRAEGISIYQDEHGNITPVPYDMESVLSPEDLGKMKALIATIDKFVDRADANNPRQGPDATKLDSMTAMAFVNEECDGSEVAHSLMATVSGSLLGVSPDKISALQLIHYIKGATTLTNAISELKDGGQYLRVQQGCQSFATSLAAQLRPGSIQLSSPVQWIRQSENGCVVETMDGTQYNAKRVVVSVPTSLYHKIRFEPELPATKKTLAESTKFGYYAKTILVFSSPWWQESGLSGRLSSDKGPISFARDSCAPKDGQYSITCFHVAQQGQDWSELSAEERQRTVLQHYRNMFSVVMEDVPDPVKILEKEWSKDPWFGGASVPIMMPGVMTSDAGAAIREAVGHIHFVGTETATEWMGYMEGAIRSGIRGRKEVVTALK